jgi:cytoskeletal protein CcmA (bactofilin family)
MNGTVRADGSVRVDGEFEGTLESGDTLVIGKEGQFRGDVKVKRAVIGGRFEGNIHASVKVELHSGCEMLGEVVTPSLVIEEGVVFEGSCKMGAKSQPRDAKGAPRPAGSTQTASPSMGTAAPSTAGVGAGSYERKN